ncbi:hypothetical protein DRQ29_01730 [bacterium]|nr:MAG: hypothetical protein DRQ29_01730 [bacterium]
MKKLILLSCMILITISFANTRIAIAELFGAHTCGSCRNAHSFLSALRYTFEDSAAVLEFHLGDGLEITGVNTRYSHYGDFYEMGYIPHMFIDGENDSSLVYTWIEIMKGDARECSSIGIEPIVHLFDSVAFRIFLDDTLSLDSAEYKIIAVLTRDSIPYEDTVYNWVVSKFYTDPNGESYTLAPGDTIELGWNFDLEAGWNPSKCNFVIYVVGPDSLHILNGYELLVYRRDDYDFVESLELPKALISVGDTAFFEANFVNMGEIDDNYQISIAPIYVPDGWNIAFADGSSELSLDLSPLDTGIVEISAIANSAGIARFGIVFHTDELSARYDTLFYAVGAGVQNLIVNDSDNPDSTRFLDYFDGSDEISYYWRVSTDGNLGNFSTMGIDKIIWYCGEDTSSCLTAEHRSQLVNYITSLNGKLLLSGTGIGYRVSSDAGFYRIALGASYDGFVLGIFSASGTDASERFDGWTGTFSGVSRFESISGQTSFGGITAFEYNNDSPAGIYKEAGESRVVYLGFPINNFLSHTTFDGLISRVIEFFDEGAKIDENFAPIAKFSLSATPNPFNEKCEILYRADSGIIDISDIIGRTVLSQKISGDGKIVFDGKNFASGIYFVELKSANKKISSKILLVR